MESGGSVAKSPREDALMKKIGSMWVAFFVTVSLLGVFCLIGDYLPVRHGMFVIELYPYGGAYRIFFVISLLLCAMAWALRYRHGSPSLAMALIHGLLYGYVCSALALFLSYAFFFSGDFSWLGFDRLFQTASRGSFSFLLGMQLFLIPLAGYIYGAIVFVAVARASTVLASRQEI